MKLFGDKLKEVRKKNGISINYIVKKLNISRKAYWNWENERAVPTGNMIREVAKTIGISVSLISDLSDNRHSTGEKLNQFFEGINNNDSEYDNMNRAFGVINKTIIGLQKQYQQNSAVIKVLLNSVNAMFYVKDLNLKYISANDFFINMVSSSKLSFLGKTDIDFFTKTEAKENIEEDRQVLFTGIPILNKEGYIPGTRKKKWGLKSKFPVFDANSKVMGIAGTFVDITQRKNNEDIRDLLKIFMDSAQPGISIINLDSMTFIYINEAHEKIYGRSKDGIMRGGYQFWINNCIHDDDRKLFSNVKDSKSLLDFTNSHSSIRFRIIRPDGTIRHLYSEISVATFKGNNYSLYAEHDITSHEF